LPSEVDIEIAGALTIEATTSIDWVVVVDGRASRWISVGSQDLNAQSGAVAVAPPA
jgi:hypothetical protein